MVKPGDINQQQQFANDAVQAYKNTQAKKAETSKAIEDNATKFAKGGISGGMSTGNRVLDKLQQNKREKQPQNNRTGTLQSVQSQPMYDKNGNRIIQGNGRFERAQRLAAGQDQSFQGPTGYNVGAVVNQVSQNNQARTLQNAQNIQGTRAQGAQTQAPGGFNLLSYRTNNRRFKPSTSNTPTWESNFPLRRPISLSNTHFKTVLVSMIPFIYISASPS